ncbi:MAG: carboxypeptidase-like regulatory domain-containing protein [Acidobacteriia bacterium]|nr:carboxypeptidase-like regulatory domain-containing protein [Terriglobia bacterium]
MKRLCLMGLVLFVLLLLPQVARSQQNSSVTGFVTDSSGSVMVGVNVKLANAKTGFEQSVRTDDHGLYTFVQIKPASGYTLTFALQGFQTVVISDITLDVRTTLTRDVKMNVGAVATTVEVKEQGVQLNTTDASVGAVIAPMQVLKLPSLIRETPLFLMSLQAGVSFSPLGSTSNNINGSVTGARTDQNNVTVDGIDANDQAGNFAFATVGNAPVESVLEFRAVTAVPDAQSGRSSGADVAIITKSGTNNFHGSLYEYNRTAATAANDWFNNRSGVARPALTRNQYGGSVGGPIKKDKLFFFFNFEGRKDRRGSSVSRTVPLTALRNGGLNYITNAAGCSSTARLNNPATAGCIASLTASQIAAMDPQKVGADAALLNVINGAYPSPNDLTGGDGVNSGLFRFNAPVVFNRNTMVGRIDYNINSKQKIFGRFNIIQGGNGTQVVQQFPDQPTPEFFVDKSYSWAIGHTYVINASTVNQFTAGISRQNNQFNTTFLPSFPNSIGFGPFSGAFPGLSSQSRIVPTWTFRDDFSKIKGHHNFQFGADLRPITLNTTLTNAFNFLTLGIGGNLSGLGSSTVGGVANPLRPSNILNTTTNQNEWDGMFTFLLGRFASQGANFNYDPSLKPLPLGSTKQRSFRYNEMEYYFQDTWRLRNDLTMVYGVRWSYYSPPYEVNGFETTPNVGLGNLFSIRQLNGALGVGGDGAAPYMSYDLAGKTNGTPSYFQPTLTNFNPRLNFAWSPSFKNGLLGVLFGDRKTSVRWGGSLVNDRLSGFTFIADQLGYLFDDSTSTPFGASTAAASLLTDPRFKNLTASPVVLNAPAHSRPATPFVNNGFGVGEGEDQFNYAVDPNFRTPYEYIFNFGVQRELKGNILFEVDYVGRMAHRLFSQADAAQIVDFRDPASGQMLSAAFAPIELAVQGGSAAIAALANQPWFENQMNLALAANFGPGTTCQSAFHRSCTQQVALGSTSNSARIGSLSNVVRILDGSGFLMNNVGLYGQFSAADYISSLASSNYNGMLVSVKKRLSHGLLMDFNYTWSHAIDNQSSVANTVSGGTLCDLRNLRTCRSNSDFDLRHIVVSDWIYSLPFGQGGSVGRNAPGWLNQIIGGWQVTGVWYWHTGNFISFSPGDTPISRTVSGNAVFTGAPSLLSNSIHTTTSGLQFFNDPTATLTGLNFPLGGTTGQRNLLPGPHFWNVDAALLKDFKLPWKEGQTLEIRAEAFNLFNHENFAQPNNSITSASFGLITGTSGNSQPRQVQFAIRFDF